MGVFFILVVDLLKTSPHILTLHGHIINCHSDDRYDVLQRRCNFTVQANNVFCFFKTLEMHIKIKLFKSYCSSIYWSELWSLEDDVLHNFCCSWRTAIRRLLNRPFNAHCFLLPISTGTLPIFDEIRKRSSRFINSCHRSRNNCVRSIALHSIVHGTVMVVGRRGVVGSTLAFGSIGHGFDSEHRLFSHHGASAFSKLRSQAKCSQDDSVRRLL